MCLFSLKSDALNQPVLRPSYKSLIPVSFCRGRMNRTTVIIATTASLDSDESTVEGSGILKSTTANTQMLKVSFAAIAPQKQHIWNEKIQDKMDWDLT
ncbi:hypothetical protein MUK42_23073 [Musa troglodytarum]|uniref:Uncharacterized protein n=1 Tax=Musa troglodytarum TaxID=320322 RepID=A0A9E7GEC6_9LILI|nr:hypothetical protein MUK42_23073 [Musa troglodytarum]